MISRRRFLEASGLAVGVAAASHPLLASAAQEKQESSLPQSIARLKSRQSEATPITREERHERQERARKLMSENALDAIVLMEGTSLRYFTGIRWWGGERLFALVLPVKGAAFYVCPAFEEGRAREQLSNAPDSEHSEVRIWQEDDNPYHVLSQGLKDRSLVSGNLGIEETVRFVFADGIAKAAPQATLTSATPVSAGCRRIKSAHEIALMRLACQVTLAAYEAVYHALREGMTQHDVGDLIDAAYRQLGFRGEASLQIGEYSALPHGSRTPQMIREGSIVMIDDGCDAEGYRKNEDNIRHCSPRTIGRAGGSASWSGMRSRRCCGQKSDYRRRLWPGLQIFFAPPGPRDGHGRARVALPGPRQRDQTSAQHDL